MYNKTITDALDGCKEVLIEELKKELMTYPDKSFSMNLTLALPRNNDEFDPLVDVMYNIITKVSVEEDKVMVDYEDYYNQYHDPIDLFNIGEIADIIDEL